MTTPVAYLVAPCTSCGQTVRLQAMLLWAPGRGTYPAHLMKIRHKDPATGDPCLLSGSYHGPVQVAPQVQP